MCSAINSLRVDPRGLLIKCKKIRTGEQLRGTSRVTRKSSGNSTIDSRSSKINARGVALNRLIGHFVGLNALFIWRTSCTCRFRNMDPMTIAAASGLRSRMESLDLLANNIANADTSGYKTDREFYSLYTSADAEGAGYTDPLNCP